MTHGKARSAIRACGAASEAARERRGSETLPRTRMPRPVRRAAGTAFAMPARQAPACMEAIKNIDLYSFRF